jgi:hypothetical protein
MIWKGIKVRVDTVRFTCVGPDWVMAFIATWFISILWPLTSKQILVVQIVVHDTAASRKYSEVRRTVQWKLDGRKESDLLEGEE